VAPERAGIPADKENYVSFLANLRNALDNSGSPTRLGLSITIVREKQSIDSKSKNHY
jgi:GH18 family chitinase